MRIRSAIPLVLIIVSLLFVTYKYGYDKSLIDFKDAFLQFLPKILTALLVIVIAQVLIQIIKPILAKVLARLEQRYAILAVFSLIVNIIAILAALSVLVGNVSSFITSLGLIGLGITWALQTPILCFTGWLLINLRGYYRIGDRIKVNDIYGDVTEIDFLNTTVWEYGSAWFTAEQPSGRLITIPNSLVLQTAILNYTRDFPYIWDELVVSMAYESDLAYTKEKVIEAAKRILKDSMVEPIRKYREILMKSKLDYRISEEPEVFLTFGDSAADLHLRYLVPARERRGTKTVIYESIFTEFAKPDHAERIKPVYPRTQIQHIDRTGSPKD